MQFMVSQNGKERATPIIRITDTLFAAFKDDPLWRYVLPDARTRERALYAMFHEAVIDTVGHGVVFVTSPALEGASLCLRSKTNTGLRHGLARQVSEIRLIARLLPCGLINARSMMAYLSYLAQSHRELISGPYWLLDIIGVRQEHQGKGYGALMLRELLTRVDEDRLPVYLETQNEKNVALYHRFGFEVIREAPLPNGWPRFWTMKRLPA